MCIIFCVVCSELQILILSVIVHNSVNCVLLMFLYYLRVALYYAGCQLKTCKSEPLDEDIEQTNGDTGDSNETSKHADEFTGQEGVPQDQLTCGDCNKKCLTPTHLRLHNLRVHAARRPFTCASCCRSFFTKSDLGRHLCIRKRQTFECEICSRQFRRFDSYKDHVRGHSDERTYSCEMCRKRFPSIKDLNRHRHVRLRPFNCNLCCRKFSRASLLQSHMVVHSRVPCFRCGTCERSFYHLAKLRAHTRTHVAWRPFLCRTCFRRFRYKKHFEEHMRIHLAKTFICEICGEAFNRSDLMKCHMLQHVAGLTHMCDVCSEEFLSASELAEHVKSHAPEQSLRVSHATGSSLMRACLKVTCVCTQSCRLCIINKTATVGI